MSVFITSSRLPHVCVCVHPCPSVLVLLACQQDHTEKY